MGLVLSVSLVACASAAALTGCKTSYALKEVKYTQDAEQVDTDNPTKVKVSSPDGEIDPDANVKDFVVGEGASKTKEGSVNVVYSSKNPQTDLPVSKFIYDSKATASSEASEGVSTKSDTSSQEGKKDDQDKKQDPDKSKKDNSKKNNKDKGDKKKDNKTDSKKPSKNKGDGDSSKTDTDKKGKVKVYDTTGEDADIPSVGSVAACGQTAVIVQMLGGQSDKSPLVAADAELLGSEFSNVFSDEGASKIKTGWSDDGDFSAEAKVDAIVSVKPDTVLVDDSGYFSKKQQQKLADAKISVTVVPDLSSDTRIKAAVNTIGTMLDSATGGESKKRAEEYVKYHDALLKDIMGSNGYGSHDKVYYDADASGKNRYGMYNSDKWTLLVDDWDYKASYSGDGAMSGSVTTSQSGLGLSTVGYRSSPVSFYMGVAGVINNGAAMDESKGNDGLLIPVWQFSTSVYDMSKISWSTSSIKKRVLSIGNKRFDMTPLTTSSTKADQLGKNGFGSKKFPKVIVGSKKMKAAFVSGSAKKGPYCVYDPIESGSERAGFEFNGTHVYAAIHPGTDLDKSVLVNPSGLFSDWTQGSVESFLESAWIASIDEYKSSWKGSVKTEVKDFYKTFYRYDLSASEVDKILEGSKE